MKLRYLFFIFFSLQGIGSIAAQVVYSLNDCISTGLDRNYSIRIARNNESKSENNYSPGNAGYLPSLDLTGRYNGSYNNITSNLTSGENTVSNGVHNTTGSASVALNWTIFNGFNVTTTYKKLNELKMLGEFNTRLSVESYVSSLISAYYSFIQQEQLVNNQEYAVRLSRERLRIDQERYQLGSSSKLQVLQSRVYLNSDSSNLSRQIESLRATQIQMNELMAVEDLGQEFNLLDTSIFVKADLLYEKLLEDTKAANTSLRIAEENKVISGYDYKIVVSRVYPYLNLSTGYGYTYNTYSATSTKNQATLGMNYGLTLGFNIFDGFNSRREIRNSALDVQNMELKYSEVENSVIADLITIYNGYSNNLQLMKLEEQNLETASENFSIAMERYRLGELSGLDLRDVQKGLLDARESLFTVKYRAKLAEISLMLISGHIMDYYN